MTDGIKLRAVRSHGYKGGWKWIATLPNGGTMNASLVLMQFMFGCTVANLAPWHGCFTHDIENILRAMMNRKRR